MEDQRKVVIKFEFQDQFRNRFAAESEFEVFHDLGEDTIDRIGEQLNVFLRQAGYIRNNDHIFMEDVTEDERDAIAFFLDDYRREKLECNNTSADVEDSMCS